MNHSTDTSIPFYPIPSEAITLPHWVEGGAPASVDQRSSSDRHMLIVDRDNRHLYESVNISGFTPELQKIFRAMKRYGLIVADNGSDLYVSGTYDTRWDNSVLNPAFHSLVGTDFEVITLGFAPQEQIPGAPHNVRILP